MPLHTVACASGHKLSWGWVDLILRRWEPDFRCPHCDHSLRLFGKWEPPKASPDDEPWREYEVLYIAYLEDDAPQGDRWLTENEHYLPVLILAKAERGSGDYVVWPRYWVKPGAAIRFGQDGPRLSIEEWEYLMAKVRSFIARRKEEQEGHKS